MTRWIAVLGVLGSVALGLLFLVGTGCEQQAGPAAHAEAGDKAAPRLVAEGPGPRLVALTPVPAAPGAPQATTSDQQGSRIVVTGHVAVVDKQEVATQRDSEGQVLLIGTEIKPGEVVPPDLIIRATVGFVGIEIKEGENVPRDQIGR